MIEKDIHSIVRTVKTEMQIIYQDEIGIIAETIDENGVSFCDGKAYFNDKVVEMTALISIKEV